MTNIKQLELIDNYQFPQTRYQGSKQKIVDWIWENICKINFETVLDAFGGTGCVSYLLKCKGKTVTYNDILKFNWTIGKALIENDDIVINNEEIQNIIKPDKNIIYPSFIQDNFKNIYFNDEENKWLDIVIRNIELLENEYKKAIALFALFQSCIIKRPYNLFHRKNLYIRTSEIERSFGNKVTWDTPFEKHFIRFVNEANMAVFDNNKRNKSINMNVFEIENKYDMVYIDTPYISKNGIGVDYHHFYHFLEGIMNYNNWIELIDKSSKHKRLKAVKSFWADKNKIYYAFDKLINKFRNSTLVISYRSDGIPSTDDIKKMLKNYKSNVDIYFKENYKYVLSTNTSSEVLIIGQ